MFDDSILLIADGDDRLRAFLAAQLDADGATVHVAADGAQARARAATYRPDALVLGALDTPAAAVALVRAIRGSGGMRGEPAADLPVLILLPERDELSMLRAFEAGADDVAARPVPYALLRARLRVLLGLEGCRSVGGPTVLRLGGLEVDEAAREVRVRGDAVELSAKEFALLQALIADPSRVRTKQELLREIWGHRTVGTTRTLDSHACRLRAKLAVHGDRYVVNVWGVGYRLVDVPARDLRAVA